VISRAPVRYNFPAAPSEIPSSEAELQKALDEEPEEEDQDVADAEDAPRSLRPGQKGFAQRLMSKYGWSKGSGLGADGSGIVNPLRVQVEKRKKKPDSEGGGFADPKGVGKIIGGKRKEKDGDGGKFGAMTQVIILRGMVDGMNLDEEVEGSGDGGLMQEIGDECSEKYGRVERVYIHRNGMAPATVFVKFTSELSALRAVNALEGRIFSGNTISAMFYDPEKFERGIFD
jgi:splicing factor 45